MKEALLMWALIFIMSTFVYNCSVCAVIPKLGDLTTTASLCPLRLLAWCFNVKLKFRASGCMHWLALYDYLSHPEALLQLDFGSSIRSLEAVGRDTFIFTAIEIGEWVLASSLRWIDNFGYLHLWEHCPPLWTSPCREIVSCQTLDRPWASWLFLPLEHHSGGLVRLTCCLVDTSQVYSVRCLQ